MKRIIRIIYQCLLFAWSAERALLNLREDEEGRYAAAGVHVFIQIQALNFLGKKMAPNDYRRTWIDKRFAQLRDAAEHLIEQPYGPAALAAGKDEELGKSIRERAYAKWEKEGCPEGEALKHWAEAEHDELIEPWNRTVLTDAASK